MIEVWKEIQGYEGLYEISNLGRVKSLERYAANNSYKKKEKILKGGYSKGYHVVLLYKNSRRVMYRVHRLVAEAFIPNPENKPQVNHLNEIKHDNEVYNLEWCTQLENNLHGSRRQKVSNKNKNRGTSKKIYQYDFSGNFIKEYPSVKECGRQGFSHKAIYKAIASPTKKSQGFLWSYKKLKIIEE